MKANIVSALMVVIVGLMLTQGCGSGGSGSSDPSGSPGGDENTNVRPTESFYENSLDTEGIVVEGVDHAKLPNTIWSLVDQDGTLWVAIGDQADGDNSPQSGIDWWGLAVGALPNLEVYHTKREIGDDEEYTDTISDESLDLNTSARINAGGDLLLPMNGVLTEFPIIANDDAGYDPNAFAELSQIAGEWRMLEGNTGKTFDFEIDAITGEVRDGSYQETPEFPACRAIGQITPVADNSFNKNYYVVELRFDGLGCTHFDSEVEGVAVILPGAEPQMLMMVRDPTWEDKGYGKVWLGKR